MLRTIIDLLNPAKSDTIPRAVATAIVVLGGAIAFCTAALGYLCEFAGKLGLPTVGCP